MGCNFYCCRNLNSHGEVFCAIPGAETQSTEEEQPTGGRFRDGGDGDAVVIQGHRAIQCQGIAVQTGAVIEGDATEGKNAASHGRADADGGRGTDLPIYVTGLRFILQHHGRIDGGRQGAANLEDEQRVGIVQGIQRERSGQLGGGGKVVNAGGKDESTQVRARQGGQTGDFIIQRRVGGLSVGLGLLRDGDAVIDGANHTSGTKTGGGGAGIDAEIAGQNGAAGAGNRGSSQGSEAGSGAERLRGAAYRQTGQQDDDR